MISNTLDYIVNRRSALAFSSQMVSEENIRLIFEAARWAPSAYNEQPWRFFYASRSNFDSFKKLIACLVPANAEWAASSSLIIISTAKKHLTLNGEENGYALHDTGLATANLLIQAEAMGMVTHVMGGFNKEMAARALNLPNEYFPVAAIAVGFSGDVNQLNTFNKKRAMAPRQRKEGEEIAIELK
jgi:nitroreductase